MSEQFKLMHVIPQQDGSTLYCLNSEHYRVRYVLPISEKTQEPLFAQTQVTLVSKGNENLRVCGSLRIISCLWLDERNPFCSRSIFDIQKIWSDIDLDHCPPDKREILEVAFQVDEMFRKEFPGYAWIRRPDEHPQRNDEDEREMMRQHDLYIDDLTARDVRYFWEHYEEFREHPEYELEGFSDLPKDLQQHIIDFPEDHIAELKGTRPPHIPRPKEE